MARKKRSSKKSLVSTFRALKRWLLILSGAGLALFGGFFLPGKVVKVHDGDTITVMKSSGALEKIRLYGIDAPESDQAWGLESTAFTNKTVLLEKVEVQSMYTDPYGRTVAIIHLENKATLNELLVRNGHAWVDGKYCKSARCVQWKASETLARSKKAGLWANNRATPPWRWRANQRRNNR